MNILRAFLLLILSCSIYGQVINPQIMDLESFGSEYLPRIEVIEDQSSRIESSIRQIDSPFGTMSVVIREESDLTKVGYGESLAEASVLLKDIGIINIVIEKYKSYEIEWLNEDLLQVVNWPGRCVELHTIYSILEKRIIYTAGFNHCGM